MARLLSMNSFLVIFSVLVVFFIITRLVTNQNYTCLRVVFGPPSQEQVANKRVLKFSQYPLGCYKP